MKVSILVLAILLQGCLTATINCPTQGPPIVATMNMPDVTAIAQSVLSMLTVAGLLAAKPKPAPKQIVGQPSAGTITLKTLAILGNQSISCGPLPPHINQ